MATIPIDKCVISIMILFSLSNNGNLSDNKFILTCLLLEVNAIELKYTIQIIKVLAISYDQVKDTENKERSNTSVVRSAVRDNIIPPAR
jgi:hypothetical protein